MSDDTYEMKFEVPVRDGCKTCVVLKDVLAPDGQKFSLSEETVSPFGAVLERAFERFRDYGSQYVCVPQHAFTDFADKFKTGGYQVLEF